MATRRTTGEIEQIVGRYRSSGLSQREFSLQTGIKLSTLGRYLRRSAAPAQLVRVKLEEASEPDTSFLLMLANGRRIASGWGFADAGLARLIRIAEQS